ncbi:hypothetical protein ACH5RR_015741 [Cinchona calisaya]|uniref:Uncharacterized protein n=1 Tax=Cinchona calisaya TaxID=153742 RepID=A0ABD2ZWP2_9GENT
MVHSLENFALVLAIQKLSSIVVTNTPPVLDVVMKDNMVVMAHMVVELTPIVGVLPLIANPILDESSEVVTSVADVVLEVLELEDEFIIVSVWYYCIAMQSDTLFQPSSVLISWKKPMMGIFKLNVDGYDHYRKLCANKGKKNIPEDSVQDTLLDTNDVVRVDVPRGDLINRFWLFIFDFHHDEVLKQISFPNASKRG